MHSMKSNFRSPASTRRRSRRRCSKSARSSITFADRGDEPVLEPKPGEIRLWSDTLVRALFDAAHERRAASAALPRRLGPHITTPRACERCETATGSGYGSRIGNRCASAGVCGCARRRAAAAGRCRRRSSCDSTRAGVRHRHAPDHRPVPADAGRAAARRAHRDRLWMRLRHPGHCGAEARRGARRPPWTWTRRRCIATRDNAVRNGVSAKIEIQSGAGAALQPADCVVANILAEPLIELAPTLAAACAAGGDLLLSGLLEDAGYAVKAAYASAFDMVQVIGRDDWCCIHARRASLACSRSAPNARRSSGCRPRCCAPPAARCAAAGAARCSMRSTRLAEDANEFTTRRIAARDGGARR